MDEKELQEFNLDDILKEFGEGVPEVAEEAPAQEQIPEAPEEIPELVEEAPVAEPAVTADTIRLDQIQTPEAKLSADAPTQRFAPVTEEETEEPQADEMAATIKLPQEEAFGENWQPQFEQPINDYIPPQPILFRPRSRLRELKRKLVAGPEKRYYELSELGVGKLQIAIFLCFMVVLGSAAVTAMCTFGDVPESRMRLMIFIQFFAMMLSALLGSFQLLEGVLDLANRRFSLNTLLVVTFVACCVDGAFGLKDLRIPCCAAFSLEMLMSLWATYHKRVTEMGQMDTLRKAVRLDGIVRTSEFLDGKDGLLRCEGEVEDFMDFYAASPKPENVLGTYGLIATVVSIGAGVVAAVLHSVSLGVQVLAVSLLAAMPATAFIAVSRPTALLEKRLHRLGSVICGWRGVEGLKGKLVFPVTHGDLFPAGAYRMNGVKFYGDRDPDEVVAYATALIEASGSGLGPLFSQVLESRNGRHYDVMNLNFYNNGGVGGEVRGEPVLAGNLSFMKDMGVEIPEGTRVEQAVYVSVDGDLCGLFAITYSKSKSAAAGISALCSTRGITPALTTTDFMLTGEFIRSKFGANTRRMAFPNPEVRGELAAKEPQSGASAYALSTDGGLASFALAVTGARSLRTAAKLGVAIHMIGGIVGLAMMVILAVMGQGHLLTPANMFLYELVWMVPGLLLTEWTRSA